MKPASDLISWEMPAKPRQQEHQRQGRLEQPDVRQADDRLGCFAFKERGISVVVAVDGGDNGVGNEKYQAAENLDCVFHLDRQPVAHQVDTDVALFDVGEPDKGCEQECVQPVLGLLHHGGIQPERLGHAEVAAEHVVTNHQHEREPEPHSNFCDSCQQTVNAAAYLE
jgi:hypothetical protein